MTDRPRRTRPVAPPPEPDPAPEEEYDDDEEYEDEELEAEPEPEPEPEPAPRRRRPAATAEPTEPITARPRPKAAAEPVKPEKDPDATPNWEDVLGDLASSGSRNFIYLKAGKTRVRLLKKPGQPHYIEVPSTYRGRTKTKFMLLALNAADEGEEAIPKGLVISKTCFRNIVGLLTEGYDLFDPKDGYGITIIRTGTGMDTTFSVLPTPKPRPINPAILKDAWDLKELAVEYATASASRAKKDGEDDDATDDSKW